MKNREYFKEYEKAFLAQNSYLNLISKNDEKFLWEKHIFDSLAIEKFFEKYFLEGKRVRELEGKLFNHNDCTTAQLQDCMSVNNSLSEISQNQQTDKNLSTFQPFNHLTDNNFKLLDIGTGGGFPAVPIALSYPEIEVYALDSIRKKINAIENIKAELGLNNLHTICDRAENIASEGWKAGGLEDWQFNKISLSKNSHGQKADNSHTSIPPYLQTSDIEKIPYPSCFDLITSRAVAPIKVIVEYALPLLKNDGYFITYKSVKAQEEIEDAKQVLKKYKAKVVDIIQYDLPLDENYTRSLVVITKK